MADEAQPAEVRSRAVVGEGCGRPACPLQVHELAAFIVTNFGDERRATGRQRVLPLVVIRYRDDFAIGHCPLPRSVKLVIITRLKAETSPGHQPVLLAQPPLAVVGKGIFVGRWV